MAHDWQSSQHGLRPFQNTMAGGGYSGQPAHGGSGAPGLAQQNTHAFQQNTQTSSVNPFSGANPAHIAALLQQLQAAGYPLPPLPEAAQAMQQPPPALPAHGVPTPQFVGQTPADDMGGKAVSEEGELSDGEDDGSSSEYDPAQPAFTSVAPERRDDARRRLSDERRYDRYNGGVQRNVGSSWQQERQSFPRSTGDTSPTTPHESWRGALQKSPFHQAAYSAVEPVGDRPRQAGTRPAYSDAAGLDPNSAAVDTRSRTNTVAEGALTQTATLAGASGLVEQIISNLAPSSADDKTNQTLAAQTEHARNFVSLLSFYGVVFQNLIRESYYFNQDTDSDHLAKIFTHLNLPVPAEAVSRQGAAAVESENLRSDQIQREPQPLREPDVQIATTVVTPALSSERLVAEQSQAPPLLAPDPAASTTPATAIQSNAARSTSAAETTPKSTPASSRPQDNRAAYLAKLKAAKMKVAKPGEGGTKSASASATPPVQTKAYEQPTADGTSADAEAAHATEIQASKVDAAATARAQSDAEARKKRQTELLQQRLAALKAKQATASPAKAAADASTVQAAQTADASDQNATQLTPLKSAIDSNSSNGGFPGLAMPGLPFPQTASKASGHPVTDLSQASGAASSSRKRPVAADFEDFTATPTRPAKQARSYVEENQDQYEPMVIDVSDDEVDSEDGGVGVHDEVTDLIRTTADAMRIPSNQRSVLPKGPGALPDFPPTSSASNTSSLLGTPGAASTPGAAEYGLQLAKSELQIAEMKAKIAARQALQRRRLNSSRPETPQKAPAAPGDGQPEQTNGTANAIASPHAQPNPVVLAPTTQLQAVSQNVHESVERLVNAGSTTDANQSSSLVATHSELTPPYGQQPRVAAAAAAAAADPADSAFASEGSIPQIGNVAMPGLRQEIAAATASELNASRIADVSMLDISDGATSDGDDEELYATDIADTDVKLAPNAAIDDDFEMSDEDEDSDGLEAPEHVNGTSLEPQPTEDAATETFQPTASHIAPVLPSADDHLRRDQRDDERQTIAEQSQHTTSSSSDETGEEDDDEDDFYEPDAATAESVSVPRSESTTHLGYDDLDLHGSSSSASVSEGATEAESVAQVVPHQQSVAASASGTETTVDDEDDDDMYEVAEAIPQQVIAADDTSSESSISESPRSSAAEDADIQQGEILAESAASHSASISSSQSRSGPPVERSWSDPHAGMPSAQHHDEAQDQSQYRPYQSPLRMFKDYRYHPQYSSDVQGGYRSMTYSHQIDANRPLCPYEADGGICNDPDCQGQHFKGMQLNDDMVLVQLGTKNPGRDDAERSKWNEGLRNVLKQLRLSNTRDPDTVAAAIAAYRRNFLEDHTKVLHM